MSDQGRQNGARRRGRPARYDYPVEALPGATRFSEDPETQEPLWLVREFKRHTDLLRELRTRTTINPGGGRPRARRDWGLLYLAFVLSGQVELTKFRANYAESPLWAECGFPSRPPYDTISKRFDELQGIADEFLEVAAILIRRARAAEPRIGRWVDVDGTCAQSNSRLEHCCSNVEMCRAHGGGRKGRWLPRISSEEVDEVRRAEAKAHEAGEAPELPRTFVRGAYRYFRVEGHTYRSKDTSSGLRSYDGDFWFGGNKLTALDRFTGGRLVDYMVEAGVNEFIAYETLIERLHGVMGAHPLGVAADRGFAYRRTFEFNTRRGIASAFQWRKWGGNVRDMRRADEDSERYDRHGVPRCQHCGGPGNTNGADLGLQFTRAREPYLAFRCMLGHTDECGERQRIDCSENWRLLVPLSRLTPEYHQLAFGRTPSERVHHQARRRYGACGKDQTGRVKRKLLVPAQELRLNASLIIEWFRILHRHGWLEGSVCRNQAMPIPCSGGDRFNNTIAARRSFGLDLPYGPKALAIGLAADAEPPQRSRAVERVADVEPPAGSDDVLARGEIVDETDWAETEILDAIEDEEIPDLIGDDEEAA